MNNFGIKQMGILKCQAGTPRGGLVNHSNSGTWGDRGRGNELLSFFENGLSWFADKLINAGDYAEQGLSYFTGLLPGGMTAEESLEDTKLSLAARNAGEPGYTNIYGEYKMFPMTGMPPALPALPKNASPELVDMFKGLEKQWRSYSARESQMKKAGLLDKLKSTLTVKRYEEKEKAFNNAVEEFKANQPHLKKMQNDVVLTKKQTAAHKGGKYMSSGDLRAANSGRPREDQWNYVEEQMRKDKDPKIETLVNRLDRKKALGMDPKLWKQRRKETLMQYIKMRPGFFDYLLKK